jgi:hypothetical protein
MPNCMLTVRYAEQKDATKCWLASAWMVINFSSPKGIAEVERQLAPLSTSTAGLEPSEFAFFMRKTRFKELWPSLTNKATKWPPAASWTPEGVESALRLNGPLWSAGMFYGGFPHAVAVFGVQNRLVCFHDPLIGPNLRVDIDQFNRAIKGYPRNPVLCYPT